MTRHNPFRKPTSVALAAALAGVALHGAVFFLVRIEVDRPREVPAAQAEWTFLGEASGPATALLDPLVPLLPGGQNTLPSGVRDFREISISREISAFPPSLALLRETGWSDWIPRETAANTPGAWIVGRTVNPLRDYARDPLIGDPLERGNVTVRIEDLATGAVRSRTLSDPPGNLAELLADASAPNPPVFLLDRSAAFVDALPLPVSSSGNVEIDRALAGSLFREIRDALPSPGYYRLTVFLPDRME